MYTEKIRCAAQMLDLNYDLLYFRPIDFKVLVCRLTEQMDVNIKLDHNMLL